MNKNLIYGLISLLVIFTLFLSFATPTTPLFSNSVVKIGDLFETGDTSSGGGVFEQQGDGRDCIFGPKTPKEEEPEPDPPPPDPPPPP